MTTKCICLKARRTLCSISSLARLLLITVALIMFRMWSGATSNDYVVSVRQQIEPGVKKVTVSSSEKISAKNHSFSGIYNLVENINPSNRAKYRSPKWCSLDYMNDKRLPQNHPCVINIIKKHYLLPPAPRHEPYNLDHPEVKDPSAGQAKTVRYLFRSKINGFFIECGALDGEISSNTLFLERYMNWTGLLIEADRGAFQLLRRRKRKSWSAQVCLSPDPYPKKVTFRSDFVLGHIVDDNELFNNHSGKTNIQESNAEIQCFPLYSLLLAVGRTKVDYFSLDIEGYEPYILRTIPFHMLNITVLSVEWLSSNTIEYVTKRRNEIVDIMMSHGYVALESNFFSGDLYFVKADNPEVRELYANDTVVFKYDPLAKFEV